MRYRFFQIVTCPFIEIPATSAVGAPNALKMFGRPGPAVQKYRILMKQ